MDLLRDAVVRRWFGHPHVHIVSLPAPLMTDPCRSHRIGRIHARDKRGPFSPDDDCVRRWLTSLTIRPETFGPMILKTKARRIRAAQIPGYEHVKAPVEDTDRTLLGIYKVALTRPWIILFDTISLLCAIYMSIVYTLLYMLFSIYPIVFQQRRGWNAGVGELPLIGTVVGSLLGAVVVVVDSRKKAKRVARGEKLEPEDRLPIAMIGGIGFAVTM